MQSESERESFIRHVEIVRQIRSWFLDIQFFSERKYGADIGSNIDIHREIRYFDILSDLSLFIDTCDRPFDVYHS